MYDSRYAKIWIENYESGKDFYRTEYIEPLLKEFIKTIKNRKSILDVGCGWGTIIPFLKDEHKYTGLDKVKDFFPYIKKKFKRKDLTLLEGSLPSNMPFSDEKFDAIVCSMVLHTVNDLKDSIKNILSKLKSKGRAIIIEFDDASESLLRNTFKEVYKKSDNHIQGVVTLGSRIDVESDIYFHKEIDIERLILENECNFDKKYFGKIYVCYKITKN